MGSESRETGDRREGWVRGPGAVPPPWAVHQPHPAPAWAIAGVMLVLCLADCVPHVAAGRSVRHVAR